MEKCYWKGQGKGGTSADLRQEFALPVTSRVLETFQGLLMVQHAKISFNPNLRQSHPHRRQWTQPVESRQRGRQIYQNMFNIQFFERNRLRMVSDTSEASWSFSSTSMACGTQHDFKASGISETISNRFLWKIWCKTCAMCVFENITYPFVRLGLVDVVDVNEHEFEASDISETIPNRFLLKNWIGI